MNITNNTKITIKNIRPQQTTTLLDTNSEKKRVTGNVVAGIPFIDTVDNSLDSFVIQIKDIPQRELFKPFDFVVFTINDGFRRETKEYFVLFDSVQTYSQLRKTYLHNLSLIEPTKILEKTKIFNLNLTNKYDTFFDQLTKAISNADIAFYNKLSETEFAHLKANRFYITASLEDFCENKSGRDFYFSNTDLRSVLDEMLGAYNARVTVDDVNYDADGNINLISLGYRDITAIQPKLPVWDINNQGEVIFESAENDGQNYAGTILARGNNSLAEEPIEITDVFKSDNEKVTDSTASVFLPFPISEKGLKSFFINTVAYEFDNENSKYIDRFVSLDMTKYFIPREEFDLLSEKRKRDYIPYSIGSKKIECGQTYTALFGVVVLKLKELIDYEASIEIGDYYSGAEDDLLDVTYTCSYYPLIDTVASVSKPNTYDKDDLLMGVMDSQTEQTLDIDRHGKKLAGLIKRTGNAEYYLDVKVKYYSNLLPLMSKIDLPNANSDAEKGFVLYKREYSIFDNFINCRYYFSKDYNAVQQNAGINRERQLYDIPLESSETPIVIKNYLVLTKDIKYSNSYASGLTVAALNTLLGLNKSTSYIDKTTQEEITVTGKLKYLLFQSKGTYGNYPQNTENSSNEYPYQYDNLYRFVRPICSYTLNKTMTFTANCLDNYSVDYSRDGYSFSIWGDAGNKITYNRYVDKIGKTVGEIKAFELDFAFDTKNQEAITTSFPVAKMGDFIAYGLNSLTVEYNKDRTQTPLFVYALECMPRKADYGNLIVGTEFAKKNNLVRDNGYGLKGLKLYRFYDFTFNGDENILTFANMQNGANVMDFFTVEEYTYNGSKGAVLKCKSSDDCASWAIADDSGNIYLAVNGELCDIYATVANFPY